MFNIDFKVITRYFQKRPYLLNIILIASVIGPGLITGSVDNDAGGITTYSLAGAQYGYLLLWLFIPMTIVLAIVQEMGIRMGMVTGKGFTSLIREKTGLKVTTIIMLAILATNFGTILAEFSGIAVSSQIFGVPTWIALPLASLAVWILVVKGEYRHVEKVFLILSFIYISYIFAGFLAHPNWTAAFHSTIIPSVSFNLASITIIVGLIGTTIAPWQMIIIQSQTIEKKVPLERLNYGRFDAIFGAVVSNFVAYFIVIACAATIFLAGIQVTNVSDISQALVPLAGRFASTLFAFGFLNASLFAAAILPLSTAYCFCESFGFEAGMNYNFREAPIFHGLYLGMLILAPIIILIPHISLLNIIFYSQVLLGILLPFTMILMILIINDRKIMGDYVNSTLYNIISWITVIAVMGLSVAYLITDLIPTLYH